MLEPANVSGPKDFVLFDLRFGEETTCIGYPTADGSSGSSFIFHGPILAMSSVCRNKGPEDKKIPPVLLCHIARRKNPLA